MRIFARKLLKCSAVELLEELTGTFTLVFDDGEIETDWKETVYSRQVWEYHIQYPDTPLLMRHHVQSVMKNRMVKVGTHGDLISIVHWDVYDVMVAKIPNIELLRTANPTKTVAKAEHKLRDDLSFLAYGVVNNIYNFSITHLPEYCTSLDILDFVEVILHEKVLNIKKGMEPTIESADAAQRQIKEFIMKDPDIAHNRLCKASRTGLVKLGQVLQCVGPAGTRTETDSAIFNRPITTGFGEGLRLLYESLIESRSAAKALSMSKQELQDTEYFSRKLQLMGSIVRRLHMADCGSQTYVHWRVHERDLSRIEGKYYVDDDGKLRAVKRTDKHLVGKMIRMRDTIHCNHKDPQGICSTCFGELSYSVPEDSNIGLMSNTSMASKSSQAVLSVKHDAAGSGATPVSLTDETKQFFRVSSDGNSYVFLKSAKAKVTHVVLKAQLCNNLTDIYLVEDVRVLNITNVVEMEDVGLAIDLAGVENTISMSVKQEGRLASLSHDFLNHIKEVGFGTDERGNYRVSLEGWDFDKNVMTMPLKHYNMSDHSKEIADLIQATMSDMENRDKHISPDAFLVELYNMVNSKLDVNLAVLGVITYGLMIVSAEDWDYRLPKENTRRGLGILKTLMANRSMGATMAYQGHAAVILSPWSFTKKMRPDSPFDAILMPQLAQPVPVRQK